MNTCPIGPNACLHHVQIKGEQPEALADFHARALMMRAARLEDQWICEGPLRRVLFCEGPKRHLGFAAFAFDTLETLEAYRRQLANAGAAIGPSPSPLFDEHAFAVSDPDGNIAVFGTAARDDAADAGAPDARLQHVTVRTTSVAPLVRHYSDTLGFFLADVVAAGDSDLRTAFFASDVEHHSVAAFKSDKALLDHYSYELSGWDMIRDWADHLASLDLTLRWGPGRHGPGNNLFMFLEDPEGNWIEFSAELERMDASRVTGHWPHVPRTLNRWGDAIMRS